MRLIAFFMFLMIAGPVVAETPTCVGSSDRIGVELQPFLKAMNAAGFDLILDGKCSSRGCDFKFDGGDGFVTAERLCVTKVFATSRWPEQRKRASLLLAALSTAIARRQPSSQSMNLMLTIGVADDGQSISFGDPGVFDANYRIGPYIVEISVESADVMTADQKKRDADRIRREREEKNENDKRELLERLSRGR